MPFLGSIFKCTNNEDDEDDEDLEDIKRRILILENKYQRIEDRYTDLRDILIEIRTDIKLINFKLDTK